MAEWVGVYPQNLNLCITAPPAGIDPATRRLENGCFLRLSYGGRRQAGIAPQGMILEPPSSKPGVPPIAPGAKNQDMGLERFELAHYAL